MLPAPPRAIAVLPALLPLALLSCHRGPPGAAGAPSPPAAASPASTPPRAAAGVHSPALAALLEEHWAWSLSEAPTWASTLGERRHDHRLPDNSHAAAERRTASERRYLERSQAIAETDLDPEDRITLAFFRHTLATSVASSRCQLELWSLSTSDNALSAVSDLPHQHTIRSPQDADNLLRRYRQIPRYLQQELANLRQGRARGLVANAESLRRTIAFVDGELARPVRDWALATPATSPPRALERAARQRFSTALLALLERDVRPAVQQYRQGLARDIAPHARDAAHEGLGHLPGGPACYTALIEEYTTLPLQAAELHRRGLDEIARINQEMRLLGRKLFGTDALDQIVARLRSDRSLYFTSADEILAAARAALAQALAAAPRYVGALPHARCEVIAIPAHEAPFSTVAYYRPPHADGGKPGQYAVNTYRPGVRARYELRVLSFHEAVPGHHLQIALAQEQSERAAIRRFREAGAYVEGWALYSERLADELGLYPDDLDRIGMLSFDAWRAARLVVDTGIHALGWNRQRAETFLREHTALTEENIRNEIDRYTTWPGQALSYKVGQQEILALRRRAETQLGARFDLRRFHDQLLRHGGLPLPILRTQIEAWLGRETGAPPAAARR